MRRTISSAADTDCDRIICRSPRNWNVRAVVVEGPATAIATIPNALIAGPLGFTKREFFDAEPEAANVPNVDLSLS